MRNALFVVALLGLAACQSDYRERTNETIRTAPPANPTGSVGYQQPGTGPSGTMDSSAPGSATGAAGYQGSGTGPSDRITSTPPRNPTGSAGYQR
jgi:hypothetical protein